MKGVILDKDSFDRGDIDLQKLRRHPAEWIDYASTSPDQINHRINGCEIIITNKVRLNKGLLESTPCLKLIIIAATGTDNVDLDACRASGVTVCNVRHYATPAVVQHTFALMLNLLTNQFRYHQAVIAGAWSNSTVFCLLDYPIVEIQNKTLGIIGYGALGKKVAEIAKAFGMSVQICQRPGGKRRRGRISFEQLLADSDVLTLHCPLTPDTLNLLGENEFKRMKPNAIVINTARGAIIDSTALANALQTGQIAGAGIDVLTEEPPSSSHPLLQSALLQPALLKHDAPNLIVTPHNAWATRESRQRLVDQMAEILGKWLRGHPINVVG
ncbi:D-2-hydroxyacid dehydrogenase [Candidatus Spongiihabitans sp.]|uniref:D-2-hydroxyacid dehydrogenase n=1 Tax=Candidatus Spongiihabitans sp. TaxID=3101308 RepID=UPI003C7A9351